MLPRVARRWVCQNGPSHCSVLVDAAETVVLSYLANHSRGVEKSSGTAGVDGSWGCHGEELRQQKPCPPS